MNAIPSFERRGKLSLDSPLSVMTSWRVGGDAKRLYQPADLEDLCHFLEDLPTQEPLLWLGLGSNLLIRDGGVRGTVVSTHGALTELSKTAPGIVRAEAGVPCAKVARYTARLGMTGAEFLAGIPGTMGGALAMNAGAFGGETWQRVEVVETVNRLGIIHHRRPDEFQISYRRVILPEDEWFVAVHLRLQSGEAGISLRKIKSLLSRRSRHQPTGVASCGSVFRNPAGDYAARLIEATGLKGYEIGGARISEKHANFIINTGTATAADIEALIEYVQLQVNKTHGIQLQPEVHIVGESA